MQDEITALAMLIIVLSSLLGMLRSMLTGGKADFLALPRGIVRWFARLIRDILRSASKWLVGRSKAIARYGGWEIKIISIPVAILVWALSVLLDASAGIVGAVLPTKK